MLDRHSCYELCVQSPRHITQFLRAVHGADPRVLREDFCGSAAVCRRWLQEALRSGIDARAIGVDLDDEALTHARAAGTRDSAIAPGSLTLVRADCLTLPISAGDASPDPCDVVFVGNFSIGYIHTRDTLLSYLRTSRQRLSLGAAGWGDGVFVCDIYDNADKYTLGALKRTHPSRQREIIHYTWEHRDADALTGIVTNAIHFRIELDGEIIHEITDAFVYRWRLWSFPELRDAMLEAGFREVAIYADVGHVEPTPIAHGRELPPSGIGLIVARA